MPRRIHKYDTQPFQMVLPRQDRRFRKAYYFIERLTQIDPKFNQRMREIKYELEARKISTQQANRLTSQAILEAIQRERNR